MTDANIPPVEARNADHLQEVLEAFGIWRSQEVSLVDGPGTDGSIYFDDASGARRTITFDVAVISIEECGRLITRLAGMVYRGTSADTRDGKTRHIYDRG